jgi:hypothetical protein
MFGIVRFPKKNSLNVKSITELALGARQAVAVDAQTGAPTDGRSNASNPVSVRGASVQLREQAEQDHQYTGNVFFAVEEGFRKAEQ